jgi:DNA repair exonuclease SbcCD ATPase subunit
MPVPPLWKDMVRLNSIEMNYKELESILGREFEAHGQLLSATTQVNEAIKGNDIPALQNRSSHLDSQISMIEQIEQLRGDCCNSLSRALGIERAPVKLATLIEKAPARFREKLSSLHRALKKLMGDISIINVSNRVLLEEGLELVRGRVAIIANPIDRFTQYRQGGRLKPANTQLHPFINQTA